MNYYTDVLKKYAEFTGRARRKEYWMFVLCNVIVAIVVSIISNLLGTRLISDLYLLAVLLPSLGVTIRRLHDIGRSGWWILIELIPIVGFIVLLVFTVTDSQLGDNMYGPNPKGVGTGSTPNPAV